VDPSWFRRFADIPGVYYQPPSNLDFSRIKERNATPTVQRYGDLEPSLWWKTPDGGTSESPASAHARALQDVRDITADVIRTNLAEVLELPGEPSDYHFALQSAADGLHKRRREHLSVLGEVEQLYLLDLQLIQSCPLAVTYEQDGQAHYFSIAAFGELLKLYLTEGRIAEAESIAQVAERFDAGGLPDVAAARERAAALAAEDMT
jgi:hypothetical protein